MTRAPAKATRADIERLALRFARINQRITWKEWRSRGTYARGIWMDVAEDAIRLGARPPAPKRRTKP